MKFYRLLSADEAASIVEKIKGIEWAQGRASSEYATGNVKRNRELSEANEIAGPLIGDLKARFTKSALWEENFVVSMTPPRFNRYGEGEEYGLHADSAWMGRKIRTDLACTLFLSNGYEGGELCVDDVEIKCEPGVAVVYPCWRPHYVKPATKGERISAIAWMQSLFRDETEREVVQMLAATLGEIKRDEPEGRLFAGLSSAYSKIMRMWMEN